MYGRSFWFVIATVCVITSFVIQITGIDHPATGGQLISAVGVLLFAMVGLASEDDDAE